MGPVGEPRTQEQVAKDWGRALVRRDDWRFRRPARPRGTRAWLRSPAARPPRPRASSCAEDEDQNGSLRSSRCPSTWEGYLGSLPAKLRHEIRRKAKKLEAEAGPFRIIVADQGSLENRCSIVFVELHRHERGLPKGVFMVPGWRSSSAGWRSTFLPLARLPV
jgi:hypothetical protein